MIQCWCHCCLFVLLTRKCDKAVNAYKQNIWCVSTDISPLSFAFRCCAVYFSSSFNFVSFVSVHMLLLMFERKDLKEIRLYSNQTAYFWIFEIKKYAVWFEYNRVLNFYNSLDNGFSTIGIIKTKTNTIGKWQKRLLFCTVCSHVLPNSAFLCGLSGTGPLTSHSFG